MTRRTFFRRSLIATPFAIGGVVGHSRYIERHAVEIVDVDIDLGMPAPLSIAVLGDIHFDPLFETGYLEDVVAKVNGLSPDLILFTGDFISQSTNRIDELTGILSKAKGSLGSFAILGNHEHWVGADEVQAAFRSSGIRLLRNESVPLPGRDHWYLTGLESYWSGSPNTKSIEASPSAARHIVLAHEPDSFDLLTDSRITLQLSGHTHGGQIRVPFVGALHLPSWGKKYQLGLHERNGQLLYVNRGIGTVGRHFRLNCRPEITHLRLS